MSLITHLSALPELNTLISAKKDKLIVIDFHATWCGPCHAIAPKFESLSKEYRTQATFCKVDVDKAADIAKEYSVRAMPTFVFLRNGVKVDEVKGANAAAIETALKRHTGGAAGASGPSFPGAGHSLSGQDVAPAAEAGSGKRGFMILIVVIGIWWTLGRKYAADPIIE
ncbi:thioredoxin 1, partial [Phenoliferia sp. Uapishka_3]